MHPMDSVFSLPDVARTDFLRSVMQSYGCAYICVWSFNPYLSNRLFFLDGFYNETSNEQQQPGSSSSNLGNLAHRLFNEYKGLAFDVSDDRLPGLAFKNHRPYLELQQWDLVRLAWTNIQTQFYQEARIKAAVFMGCNDGEIELGFSSMSQDDIQTALRNLFPPEDFPRQSQQQVDQNLPSSSSSSLRSLSTDHHSPEYSSLIFNTINPAATSSHLVIPTMQPLSTAQNQFPTSETENEAIMRAILHVISSDPAPSSSSASHQQNLPHNVSSVVHPEEASAFKRYRADLGLTSQMGSSSLRRQSPLNRSIQFFRNLNLMRMRERVQATRPTSTQLHHMISERRRREKLNENFQALRALLPPGTKKDKASILTTAKGIISSLTAEIEKLSKRNQQLEALILPAGQASEGNTSLSNERLCVKASHVPESSSSGERMIDLQVAVRGQSSHVDILIRLLEFLKELQNVNLISMEAITHMTDGTALNQVTLRLRVEGDEWDESTFLEAVRRVVGDLAQ